MVKDSQLYDLLEVSPDVSEQDLKRAFKRKAQQLHPDKNPDDPQATEKFQAANEAYEILKDSEKRQRYDQYGLEGIRSEFNDGNMDIFDILFPHADRNRKPKTKDIIHEVHCKLADLYIGKEITLKITRHVICSDCQGSGCISGKSPSICSDCDGHGVLVQIQQMGSMVTQQRVRCPTCNGEGQTISVEDRCQKCEGEMIVEEEKEYVVHIEPGMEDGDRITFQGASDEYPGADAGNLVVFVREEKHDVFIRNHDDLLIDKKLTITQALLGTSFSINHLDGRILIVETPKGNVVSSNTVSTIEREGMPIRGNSYSRGKLYIKFEVIFPEYSTITPEFRNLLIQTFPPPDELKDIDLNDENVFQCTLGESELANFQNSKRSRNQQRNEAYGDEEEDNEEGGAGCQPM